MFFNYLEEIRTIKTNPVKRIKQLHNTRTPKEFISDSEFNNLLRYMDSSKLHEYRDYVIIICLLDTGMRIGECLMLTTEDIDFKNRSILLKAENTKGRKDRYVFYSQKLNQELKRWLEYKDRYLESEYIFPTNRGGALSVGNFETNFKKYAKRVKLDNAHPHQIRNNFAKRCIMSGMDIWTLSKILGHSSVTVTEKAYLDLTNDDIRKNYQKFSPLENLIRS